jgi:hypothetical protein
VPKTFWDFFFVLGVCGDAFFFPLEPIHRKFFRNGKRVRSVRDQAMEMESSR